MISKEEAIKMITSLKSKQLDIKKKLILLTNLKMVLSITLYRRDFEKKDKKKKEPKKKKEASQEPDRPQNPKPPAKPKEKKPKEEKQEQDPRG